MQNIYYENECLYLQCISLHSEFLKKPEAVFKHFVTRFFIGTVYPSRAHGFISGFMEGSVLLISYYFLLCFLFVCLRPVYCVPLVVDISGLFILGFSNVYITLKLRKNKRMMNNLTKHNKN